MRARPRRTCILVFIIFFLISEGLYYEVNWLPRAAVQKFVFAELIATMTIFPVLMLFYAATSAAGVPVLGPWLFLMISAISGLVWATGCWLALWPRPIVRKAFRGLLIFAFLLSLYPLACWWTGSTACPARVRHFALRHAEFCQDYLNPDRPQRMDFAYSAYDVGPPVRRAISVAALVMAASNAVFGAVVLSVTVSLVYRYFLAISQGP